MGLYPAQYMNRTYTDTAQRRLSDEELVRRAQTGDMPAFEQVYRRHHPLAVSLATRICGCVDAEDATQAAFISIWRNLGSYSPDHASVKTWLLSIVRHRAIDILRKRRAKPQVAISSVEAGPEQEDPIRTESLVVQRDESRAVRRAVAELPDSQRRVIELAYFDELSQSEIARALKVPLGTVKGRARLGMKKLPDRLAEPAMATH